MKSDPSTLKESIVALQSHIAVAQGIVEMIVNNMKQTRQTEAAPVSGQHTPTPWKVIDGIGCGSIYNIQAVNPPSGNGVLAAILHAPDKQRPLMVAQANAEFIVQACNCHEELVRALQDLLAIHGPVATVSESVKALNQARAALNKATR